MVGRVAPTAPTSIRQTFEHSKVWYNSVLSGKMNEKMMMTESDENEKCDQTLSPCDDVRAYAPMFAFLDDKPEITLNQVKEIVRSHEKKKLDWAILWLQRHGGRVRVDRDRFVKAKLVKWDKPGIEAAIDRQCISNVLPLGAVDFSGFPEVPGYPWTLCLLHHYVEHVSANEKSGKFVIHCVSFASVKVAGLIARKGTDEGRYWDMAYVRAVLDAGIEPDADAIGEFLMAERCAAGRCQKRCELVVSEMSEITGGGMFA